MAGQMTILGVVLAGGASSRFGSDKALALWRGRTLLDHQTAFLATQCDAVAVAGRGELADWPEPGRGPLGGIAGALLHARARGFDAVLSCAVDSLNLPDDLRVRLTPAPAYVASQPVIGLWPVTALAAAQAILTGTGAASLRRFGDGVAARAVELPVEPANVNTPGDLAQLDVTCRPARRPAARDAPRSGGPASAGRQELRGDVPRG